MNELRTYIAERLTEDENYTSKDLARDMITLAEQEGRNYAIAAMRMALASASKEEVREVAVEMVTRGPDDTWSGRGTNDRNRAFSDGVRSECERVLRWDDWKRVEGKW